MKYRGVSTAACGTLILMEERLENVGIAENKDYFTNPLGAPVMTENNWGRSKRGL